MYKIDHSEYNKQSTQNFYDDNCYNYHRTILGGLNMQVPFK